MLITLFSFCLNAQNYISISSGTAFLISLRTQERYLVQSSFSDDNKTNPIEAGWNVTIAAGRSFDKNLGLELECGYSSGPIMIENSSLYRLRSKPQYLSVSTLGIMKVQLGRFLPYIKLGPLAAFPKLTQEGAAQQQGSTHVELSGEMALGFSGRFGVQYTMKSCTLFLESGFTAFSWYPNHMKYTIGEKSGERDISNSGRWIYTIDNLQGAVIMDKIDMSDFSLRFGLIYEL